MVTPVPAEAVNREPQIVFAREVFSSRIHVSNGAGTWTEPLTSTRAEFALPRWAPQGGRILFTRVALEGRADADVMVMGPKGQDKHVLLPGEGRNFIDDIAWSPSAGRVALVMLRNGTSDLWIYTIATGKLQPLGVERHPDRIIQDVDWSRDGTIVFSALDFESPQEDSDLYVVQPDGSELRQVTNTPLRSEWGPRFSPDGRRLVFSAAADRCRHLIVANADGSDRERARVGCNAWGG